MHPGHGALRSVLCLIKDLQRTKKEEKREEEEEEEKPVYAGAPGMNTSTWACAHGEGRCSHQPWRQRQHLAASALSAELRALAKVFSPDPAISLVYPDCLYLSLSQVSEHFVHKQVNQSSLKTRTLSVSFCHRFDTDGTLRHGTKFFAQNKFACIFIYTIRFRSWRHHLH